MPAAPAPAKPRRGRPEVGKSYPRGACEFFHKVRLPATRPQTRRLEWRAPLPPANVSAELGAVNPSQEGWRPLEAPATRCELIAAGQHGVISRAQALAAGLTAKEVENRLATGKWFGLFREVYSPASVPRSWHRDLMAACLWAGEGAAISHRAAAALWGFDTFRPNIAELTTDRWIRSPRVVVHRTRRLPRCDVTVYLRIPATTPTRTLIDIAGVVSHDGVEVALDFALRRGLTSIPYVHRRLADVGGRGVSGAGVVRRLLVSRDPMRAPTESVLEARFKRLLKAARLPPAEIQQRIYSDQGFLARVDFAYPASRLVIEVDGWDHHANKEVWQHDLRRNNELTNMGWRVLRFSWNDVTKHGDRVAHQIESALGGPPQRSFGAQPS